MGARVHAVMVLAVVGAFPRFHVDPRSGKLAVVWAADKGAGTCGTSAADWHGTTSNRVKLATWDDGIHFPSPGRITHDRADEAVQGGPHRRAPRAGPEPHPPWW